jgi:hypothetical protein
MNRDAPRDEVAMALKDIAVGLAAGGPASDGDGGNARRAMVDAIVAALTAVVNDGDEFTPMRRGAVCALKHVVLEWRPVGSKQTLRMDAIIDGIMDTFRTRANDKAAPKLLRDECERALAQLDA